MRVSLAVLLLGTAFSLACVTDPMMHEPASPLMAAVKKGDIESARDLLSRGADPNATDARGWDSLHFASLQQNAGLVRLLLKAGAEPKPLESSGLGLLATGMMYHLLSEAGDWEAAPHEIVWHYQLSRQYFTYAPLRLELDANEVDTAEFYGNLAIALVAHVAASGIAHAYAANSSTGFGVGVVPYGRIDSSSFEERLTALAEESRSAADRIAGKLDCYRPGRSELEVRACLVALEAKTAPE